MVFYMSSLRETQRCPLEEGPLGNDFPREARPLQGALPSGTSRPQAWLPGSPGLQGGREPAGEAGRESPTFGIIHVVTVTLADVCERNFLLNTEGN